MIYSNPLPLVFQTFPMLHYYWLMAHPACLLCPQWPGMALCETPSWECLWINLGLAQDCLGLLGDGGGLAVTACFRGVRAADGQIASDSDWVKPEEDQATPRVEPPATQAILGFQSSKYTRPSTASTTNTNRITEGGRWACGGKLHETKPPACDHDDATAGHCPKSLKSL